VAARQNNPLVLTAIKSRRAGGRENKEIGRAGFRLRIPGHSVAM
jgi:hypothetical protein